MLQDPIILANEFSAQISQQFTGVEDVILFGSVARGDNGANSDIDLLIVTDEPGYKIDNISERYDACVEVLVKYGQSFKYWASNKKYHILYCQKADLEVDTPLIQNIAKDGVSLI